MNIALVHDWITNMAGAEKVVLELSQMFPQAPIYTSVFDEKNAPSFKNKNIKTSFLQKIPLMKTKRTMLIPFTPFAFEQFDLSQYDIVISSSTMASKGILTKPATIHVCYCHTPPRYLWEPDIDTRAQKGLGKTLRINTMHKMRLWDRVAADRVDFFIANSKYVSARIKKYYQRDAAVIYPPVNVKGYYISEKPKDYFIYVSRLVNYKRCDLIVDAFNQLGLPLYIIGRGPEKDRLQRKAKPNIKFLGYLSDEEIKKYYSEAQAFVFAAEEDFGMVPVEAMASGRPVIAFNKGGLRESIIDGKTGILFDDQTVNSLAEAVEKFKHTNFDPSEIKKHAETFSSERFRQEMLEFLEKIK